MGVKPYEKGTRAGSGLTGMMVLKPTSKLRYWTASYGKGTTLIRPWGDTYQDDQGNIKMVPHRDNDGHFGTSFFVQDAVCKAWGKDSRYTFMACVEDEENWPAGSPADVFYTEISNHPDFKWLVEKPSAKDFAPLSRPSVTGFLKGLLLECGGKDYKSNPVWGCILAVAQSAKDAFEELLDMENPNPQPTSNPDDPNGWYQKYVVGDPIGFKEGKIFEFDKESKLKNSSQGPAEINLDARGSDGRSSTGGNDAFEKYGCQIWPKRPMLELPPQRVHSCNETFDEALRYMTGEEQISQVIVPGFGRSCRDAVLYVFGDKNVLPASYEFGRTTVDMGQNQQPSSTVQQQPQAPVQQPVHQQAPVQQPTQPTVNINLDGPDMPEEAAGDTEPPFTPDPTATVEVAEQVNHAPAGEPAQTAPPSSTANDLRARLHAAQANQQQQQ